MYKYKLGSDTIPRTATIPWASSLLGRSSFRFHTRHSILFFFDNSPTTNPRVINSTNSVSRSPSPSQALTHVHNTRAPNFQPFFFFFFFSILIPSRQTLREVSPFSAPEPTASVVRVSCSCELKVFQLTTPLFFLGGGFYGVRVAAQSYNAPFAPVPACLKQIIALGSAKNLASQESYKIWL